MYGRYIRRYGLSSYNEKNMKTINLCMIVKDEAHVIERCFDSVRPLIDEILIVDTGSTDDTVSVINNYLLIPLFIY